MISALGVKPIGLQEHAEFGALSSHGPEPLGHVRTVDGDAGSQIVEIRHILGEGAGLADAVLQGAFLEVELDAGLTVQFAPGALAVDAEPAPDPWQRTGGKIPDDEQEAALEALLKAVRGVDY